VLLAGCADEEEWSHLEELVGKQVSLSVSSNGDVIAAEPTAAALAAAATAATAAAAAMSDVPAAAAVAAAAAAAAATRGARGAPASSW
jgi:ATP-dependent protease HslVU (ClpYQ) peptidase subunit